MASNDQDDLDPQIVTLLEMIRAIPQPEEIDLRDLREQLHNFGMLAGVAEPVHHVEDRPIPGPSGPIPVRIYRPSAAPNLPVLVYFHGGGFTLGDLDLMDTPLRAVCNASGWTIVSVDYRLAPENPFPAAIDDGVAAVKWVAEHAAEIGGDGSRIAVGGDSAGGNLAAVISQTALRERTPKISAQILIYPATDLARKSRSMVEFGAKGYLLTAEHMDFFMKSYFKDIGADPKDPRLSPGLARDLSGLPPALVITAEYDPLRDEGNAYAEKLREAGVAVTLTEYEGMIHGFFGMGAMVDRSAVAVREVADFLSAVAG